jgi:hypothetical protein
VVRLDVRWAPISLKNSAVQRRQRPSETFFKILGRSIFAAGAAKPPSWAALCRHCEPQAEMSSADLHDSQRGEAMIQGDEEAYYADKAYDSAALRKTLNDKKIDDKIAYKAKRRTPQPDWQRWFNKTASSVRVGGERANATMKNWYGMAKIR